MAGERPGLRLTAGPGRGRQDDPCPALPALGGRPESFVNLDEIARLLAADAGYRDGRRDRPRAKPGSGRSGATLLPLIE